MTQIHRRRSSGHPFVCTVWTTRNLDDGVYVSTPDGSWDLILGVDAHGDRQMLLTGHATRPALIPYAAGSSSVVISFVPWVYLDPPLLNELVDDVRPLPTVDPDHFSLLGHAFSFPTYAHAEDLVDALVDAGLLKCDDVVDDLLKGGPRAYSSRTVQRHFLQATGMTHKTFQQIYRAQTAVRLLKQGTKPAEAAADAGYTDQPHLTKSLRRIMGTTPRDVDDIHKI